MFPILVDIVKNRAPSIIAGWVEFAVGMKLFFLYNYEVKCFVEIVGTDK